MTRVLKAALYVVLAIVAAAAIHNFFAYIEHYPYWSIDDGLGVISTSWLQTGRYGDPSVPVEQYSGIQRYRGFFLYGPWPFAAGTAVTWLFGFSVQALRSLHLLAALSLVLVAYRLFDGVRGAIATTLIGVAICYAVVQVQWPMVRPDPFVTLFAAGLLWGGACAIRSPRAWTWFICGLAAGCGALSHLLGATLVPASLIMLVAAYLIRHTRDQRALLLRVLVGPLAAMSAGWAVSLVTFYGSFGFRVIDHLTHVLKYRSEVAANAQTALSGTSPAMLWSEHFRIASSGVPAFALAAVLAGFVVAVVLLARAFLARRANAVETIALLLPGVSILVLYSGSLGFHPNFHTGYLMLPQLVGVWVAGAALYLLIDEVPSASPRRLVEVAIALAVIVVGTRTASGLVRVDDDPRIALTRTWIAIGSYLDEVLGPVPEGAVAWGSAPLAIKGPGHVQLISLDTALWLLARIPAEKREALVPDYVIWGHPASQRTVLSSFVAPDEDPLRQLPGVLPDQEFLISSMVSAAPYGATRVYRRRLQQDEGQIPAVSVWDAAEQRWMHQLQPFTATWVPASGSLNIARGPQRWSRQATAALTGELPEGWYVFRVRMQSGVTGPLFVTAGSGSSHEYVGGDLPPDVDVAARLSSADPIYLLRHHTGGTVGLNVYGGSDDRVGVVDTFRVAGWPDYRLNRELLASRPLPPLDTWVPVTSDGVTVSPQGQALRVSGNASQFGYQVVSPAIEVAPGAQVSIELPVTARTGRVCVGVLDEQQRGWIVPPVDQAPLHRFAAGTNRAVFVVVSNCNTTAATATAFNVEPGRIAVQSDRWYVDSLMREYERTRP